MWRNHLVIAPVLAAIAVQTIWWFVLQPGAANGTQPGGGESWPEEAEHHCRFQRPVICRCGGVHAAAGKLGQDALRERPSLPPVHGPRDVSQLVKLEDLRPDTMVRGVLPDALDRHYTRCERKKRAAEALADNGLVQSWPGIVRLAREPAAAQSREPDLFETEP